MLGYALGAMSTRAVTGTVTGTKMGTGTRRTVTGEIDIGGLPCRTLPAESYLYPPTQSSGQPVLILHPVRHWECPVPYPSHCGGESPPRFGGSKAYRHQHCPPQQLGVVTSWPRFNLESSNPKEDGTYRNTVKCRHLCLKPVYQRSKESSSLLIPVSRVLATVAEKRGSIWHPLTSRRPNEDKTLGHLYKNLHDRKML